MNFQQACDWLIDHGAKEYSDRTKPQHARSFQWVHLHNAPKCAHNERAPSLHVVVYAPFRPYPDVVTKGSVEFEVVGMAESSEWLSARVYAVDVEQMVTVLPKAESAAGAIWAAFVGAMARQEAER
jgi:hypothetical protein